MVFRAWAAWCTAVWVVSTVAASAAQVANGPSAAQRAPARRPHTPATSALAALQAWQPPVETRIDVPGGVALAITVDDLPVHGKLPPGESRADVAASFEQAFHATAMPPVYGMVNARHYPLQSPQVDVLRGWLRSGNLLGNHTDNHTSLDEEEAAKFEADIAADEPTLSRVAAGTDWHWFRYPFLAEGNTVAKRDAVRGYLQAHGYRIAEVTLDFEDYLWNDPYARCMARHDDAAVAQLERTYLATANEYIDWTRDVNQKLYHRQLPTVLLMHIGAFDAHMLPRLIALLRSRGFHFTTLPVAQDDEAYRRELHIADAGGGLLQEFQEIRQPIDFEPQEKPEKQLEAICR